MKLRSKKSDGTKTVDEASSQPDAVPQATERLLVWQARQQLIRECDENSELALEALLTDIQVAELLGVQRKTLQQWRYLGKGPKFISISRRCVRYRLRDVIEWLNERVVQSTTEASEGRR